MARKPILFLIFAMLFFIGAYVAESGFKSDHQGHLYQIPRAVKEYGRLKAEARKFAKENLQALTKGETPSTKEADGISGFVFYKDSLVWWSDNNVLLSSSDTLSGIRFVQNGWYLVQRDTNGPWSSVSLLKVKQQYPFSNLYLTNDLNASLELCNYWELAKPTDADRLTIDANDGFYLKPTPDNSEPFLLPSWLLLAGTFLLLASMVLFLHQWGLVMNLAMGFALLIIYLFRILSGDFLQQLPLWNWGILRPDQYASSWLLNSPADLILVSTILFFLSLNTSALLRKLQKALTGNFGVAVLSIAAISFAYLCNSLVAGLVLDSRTPFDFDKVFSLNGYSFLGFGIMGLLVSAAIRVSKSFAVFSSEAVASS